MSPPHQASRNFVIKALPFLHYKIPSSAEDSRHCYSCAPDLTLEQPAQIIMSILVTSSRFMNGSLTPEIFANFTLELPDVYFLRTVCEFSNTIQFTNMMRIVCPELHFYDRSIYHDAHAQQKSQKFRIIEAPPTIDVIFYRLITHTRYFIRQLVHFDFHSVDSRVCCEVFTKCLPKLTALRHLRFRFPFQHCWDDLDDNYHSCWCSDRDKYDEDGKLRPPCYDDDLISTWVDHGYGFMRYKEKLEAEGEVFFDEDADEHFKPLHDCQIVGCVSHQTSDDIVITGAELVQGLRNLVNLEFLELVLTPRTFDYSPSDPFWTLFRSNPMPHLRKLSLTIFPLTFAEEKQRMYDAESLSPFADQYHFISFRAISEFLPHLQSLAIRRMPVSFCDSRSDLPNLHKMKNLKELFLYGVPDRRGLKELIASNISSNNNNNNNNNNNRNNNLLLPCCPELVTLALGGFDTMETPPLQSDLVNLFHCLSCAQEMKRIDMRYLRCNGPYCNEISVYEDGVVETWVKYFPRIKSFDFGTSCTLSDDSLVAIGQHGAGIKDLCFVDRNNSSRHNNKDFTDEGISHLFDPEKATSNIFTSLESLRIGSRNIFGENWFGAPPEEGYFVPNTRYYCLSVLRVEDARLSAEGLIQLMQGLSECLQYFYYSSPNRWYPNTNRSVSVRQRWMWLQTDDDKAFGEFDPRVLTRMSKLSQVVNRYGGREVKPNECTIFSVLKLFRGQLQWV